MLKLKTASIVIILTITQTLFSQQPAIDTDEMIDKIVASQKAELEKFKQGFGNCTMTTISKKNNTDPITEKANVNFYFKGLATRTDIEHITDVAGQDNYSEVDTGKVWYRYSKSFGVATVKESDANENNGRELSRDFHPDVYYEYLGGLTLPTFFNKARERCDIKFNFTKEGLVECTSKYGYNSDGNMPPTATTSMFQVLFDPVHSYRPVKWDYEQKNGGFQGEYIKIERAIKWQDMNDSYYPSSVTNSETNINSTERIENMSKNNIQLPKSSTSEVRIENINVKLNTPVSDKTFTLEGMGLKNGTLVTDKIKGITYGWEK